MWAHETKAVTLFEQHLLILDGQPQTALQDDASIFEGVPETIIGDFGLAGGGAAGEEIDAADELLGTPSHALVVASSEGHTRYMLLAPETITFSISNHSGEENPRVKADIVFYETIAVARYFPSVRCRGRCGLGAALARLSFPGLMRLD